MAMPCSGVEEVEASGCSRRDGTRLSCDCGHVIITKCEGTCCVVVLPPDLHPSLCQLTVANRGTATAIVRTALNRPAIIDGGDDGLTEYVALPPETQMTLEWERTTCLWRLRAPPS